MAKGKKTGGRVKGTPNKSTQLAKDLMIGWLDLHNTCTDATGVQLIWQDFMALDPRDRVKVSVEFIKVIMPKNISIDEESRRTIEDRLVALSEGDQLEAEDVD